MTSREKRTGKPESLADVLAVVLKKRNLLPDRPQKHLNKTWKQVVGPQIAAQTRAETLKNQTLLVKVSSSVWLQQLHFLKQEITAKLRPVLAEMDFQEIRFVLDQARPAEKYDTPQAEALPDPSCLKGRDRKMISDCLESVRDPDLVEILRRVMTKEISRRRFMMKS